MFTENDSNENCGDKVQQEERNDLRVDNELTINISDALSERDKVKYTIYTKTNMPEFVKREMSVIREHDEFVWLHNELNASDEYAGLIIPPAPPRADFGPSRDKLQELGAAEATIPKEDFLKMKQELEQEYLAIFKKTVAFHEVFLRRLAAHPIFQNNVNFRHFLQWEGALSIRGKNATKIVGSIFKCVTQSADELLMSGQKEVDIFFERERHHLLKYHSLLKNVTAKADRTCKVRKHVVDSYAKIAAITGTMGELETVRDTSDSFGTFLRRVADIFDRLKRAESRVGTDVELKEADTLRYFVSDLQAAKVLLRRRLRYLANLENAMQNLERAQFRKRDVKRAEIECSIAREKFDTISESARQELYRLKTDHAELFLKNSGELAELEIKNSKHKISVLNAALTALRALHDGPAETDVEEANSSSSCQN